MSQQALYWIDGRWQSLEVDNAENLDNLDSTDFSLNGHKHFRSEITDLPGVATTTQDGFMAAGDKTKLNNIAVNANNYVHPSDANTRHVTDAEKTKWNGKADAHGHPYAATNHPHTIENITGLRAELDSIKSTASSGKDKVPSNNWKLSPMSGTISATHNFYFVIGHIKIGYLDAIRVNFAAHNIMLHTADGQREAYLTRQISIIPMTQVGAPALGLTTTSLGSSYGIWSKRYTLTAPQASTSHALAGEVVDIIPLTKDKLNPGYYAVVVSYNVGNASGTLYTAFTGQNVSSNLYVGYDE